ncbi:hypothetical protein EDC04DRAFT_2602281 [Pisolithus marmoratus]|nr:hypothetical protein EDC04DRAFT_2602281 [Pisolithus marmoratus]
MANVLSSPRLSTSVYRRILKFHCIKSQKRGRSSNPSLSPRVRPHIKVDLHVDFIMDRQEGPMCCGCRSSSWPSTRDDSMTDNLFIGILTEGLTDTWPRVGTPSNIRYPLNFGHMHFAVGSAGKPLSVSAGGRGVVWMQDLRIRVDATKSQWAKKYTHTEIYLLAISALSSRWDSSRFFDTKTFSETALGSHASLRTQQTSLAFYFLERRSYTIHVIPGKARGALEPQPQDRYRTIPSIVSLASYYLWQESPTWNLERGDPPVTRIPPEVIQHLSAERVVVGNEVFLRKLQEEFFAWVKHDARRHMIVENGNYKECHNAIVLRGIEIPSAAICKTLAAT